MAYFTFPLTKPQAEKFLDDLTTVKSMDYLLKDPKLHWDAKARVLKVDYLPTEFSSYHGNVRGCLFQAMKIIGAEDAIEKYGSEECKRLSSIERFEEDRESFRDFEKDGKFPNPPITSGVDGAPTKGDAVKGMLANSPGFCFGEAHNDPNEFKAIEEMMDMGVGMVFIEEFHECVQKDLDDFLAGGEMTKWLHQHAVETKTYDLLLKAKEKKCKVIGIDSGLGARNNGDRRALPSRIAKMNKASQKIMEKAIKENPGVKFVAVAGEAHCNTSNQGIPGLAQMFGLPTVTLENGKFKDAPENVNFRTMPSKEELKVIDKIICGIPENQQIPSVNGVTGNDRLLLEAKRLAKLAKDEGKLGSEKDTENFIKSDTLQKMVKLARVKTMPDEAKKQINEAIKDNDLPRLKMLLAEDPTAALQPWSPGSKVTVLHVAAQLGYPDVCEELLKAGADPNAVDDNDNTPLHFAALQRPEKMDAQTGRTNDDIRKGQAESIYKLFATSKINLDAVNKEGKTGLHLAAWNNNVHSLEMLHQKGAKTDIKDKRGWTAHTVAIGSTKVEAENFFYSKGLVTNPPLVGPTGPLSTVDLLMQATNCEKPEDVQKMRTHFEELYSNPSLRPIMDLAAADSSRPRTPPDGGMRFFVADGGNAGLLYNAVGDLPPEGAYDDGAHVLAISNNSSKDLQGTLIHEMTHAAARMLHGDDTIPGKKGLDIDAYKLAITGDVKRMAMITGPEKAMFTTICGRMDEYVAKAAKRAQKACEQKGITDKTEIQKAIQEESDKTLLQEFLVGIPQLIAEHGEEYVTKLCPQMTAYFKTFTKECTNATKTDNRYKTVGNRLDNSQYDNVDRLRPKKEPVTLGTGEGGEGSLSSIMDMVKGRYRVDQGTPKIPLNMSTIAYNSNLYEVSPEKQKSMDGRMKTVESVLKKALASGQLPPDISAAALKEFAEQVSNAASGDTKQIEALVKAKASEFARSEKIAYVERRLGKTPPPTDLEIAESVVLRAENAVFKANPPVSGDIALEVDSGKQKSIIKDLAAKLTNLPPDKKLNPVNLQKMVDMVSNGDSMAIYKKPGGKPKDSGHLSIDKKEARRVWTLALSKMG